MKAQYTFWYTVLSSGTLFDFSLVDYRLQAWAYRSELPYTADCIRVVLRVSLRDSCACLCKVRSIMRVVCSLVILYLPSCGGYPRDTYMIVSRGYRAGLLHLFRLGVFSLFFQAGECFTLLRAFHFTRFFREGIVANCR